MKNSQFQVNTKIEVENYPYGFREKTTAYFSVEFKKGKGFRSVFQTINPKTGKLNKPKYGTYSPVMYMKNEDGKVSFGSLDFYGWDGIVKDCKVMYEFFEMFTQEQIIDIYATIYSAMKINTKAQVVYCGSELEDIKPYISEILGTIILAHKSGDNVFDKIAKLDVEGIESKKVEGYKPFNPLA
jgi:hypothetical protein